ncbi:hypothetical protein IW261DRAFT_1424020 [Armillaria novae-zelandiae]|uniref:Uncharacterized protein n=1 Tax=Armillaria novae-zelandiae TaxID=153914 RepID=A0AA39NVY4_9AGAR|nr:hypothetical protein IW261DRAFT_1424020 [Armillaria novae-zelandiae]
MALLVAISGLYVYQEPITVCCIAPRERDEASTAGVNDDGAAGLRLAWGLEILKPSPEPSQAIIMAQAGLGIAPTLLIGHVAAGHAHPDDSWWGSIASSLHFGAGPRGQTQTSLQQDYMASAILDDDLEALQEQDNEYSHHIPAESSEVVDKSVGSQKNVPDDDPHITASVSII